MGIFQILFTVLPNIIQLVHLAEALFAKPGSGPTKLDFVTGTLSTVLGNVPAAAGQIEQIVEASKPLIGTVVSISNALGWHPSVMESAAKFAAQPSSPSLDAAMEKAAHIATVLNGEINPLTGQPT